MTDQGSFREIDGSELAAMGFRGASSPPNTRARQRVCGRVTIWSIRGDSGEYRARSNPSDSPEVFFIFKESGSISLRSPNGPWRHVEAQLMIAPHGLERRIRFEGAWRLLIVRVPRGAIDTFFSRIPAQINAFHDRRVLDLAMQRFLAAATQRDARCSALEDHAIEQLVVNMCGAVILDRLSSTWVQGDPHSALRDRALATITRLSQDLHLTPARVAVEVHSSLRQLQLVFAEADTTIATEIRRQRARHARTLLLDSRHDSLTVEQVARASGFATATSLRRALEEMYQSTPRAIRAERGARDSLNPRKNRA